MISRGRSCPPSRSAYGRMPYAMGRRPGTSVPSRCSASFMQTDIRCCLSEGCRDNSLRKTNCTASMARFRSFAGHLATHAKYEYHLSRAGSACFSTATCHVVTTGFPLNSNSQVKPSGITKRYAATIRPMSRCFCSAAGRPPQDYPSPRPFHLARPITLVKQPSGQLPASRAPGLPAPTRFGSHSPYFTQRPIAETSPPPALPHVAIPAGQMRPSPPDGKTRQVRENTS